MTAEDAPAEKLPQPVQHEVVIEVVVSTAGYDLDIRSKIARALERYLQEHTNIDDEQPITILLKKNPHTLNFVGSGKEFIAVTSGITRMKVRAVFEPEAQMLIDLELLGARRGEEKIPLPKKPVALPLSESETAMLSTAGTKEMPAREPKEPGQETASAAATEGMRRVQKPQAGEKPIEKPVPWDQERALRALLEDQRGHERCAAVEAKTQKEKKPPGGVRKFLLRIIGRGKPSRIRQHIEWGTFLLTSLEKLEQKFGEGSEQARPSQVIVKVGLHQKQIQKLVALFLMDLSSDPANRKSRFTSERVTREHVQLAQQFITERLGVLTAGEELMGKGAYGLDIGRVLRGLKSSTPGIREISIPRLALVAPQELRACQGSKQFDNDRAQQLFDAFDTALGLREYARLDDQARTAFERQRHVVARTIQRGTGRQPGNWYTTVHDPKVEARRAKISSKGGG